MQSVMQVVHAHNSRTFILKTHIWLVLSRTARDVCMLWAGIQLLHAGLQLLITSSDLRVGHAAMSFCRPEQQGICCNKREMCN